MNFDTTLTKFLGKNLIFFETIKLLAKNFMECLKEFINNIFFEKFNCVQ